MKGVFVLDRVLRRLRCCLREAFYHSRGTWSQLSSHHWWAEVILQQLYNNSCKNKPGIGVWLLARGEPVCHKSVNAGSILPWRLIYKPVLWRSAGARLCLHIRCKNGIEEMLTRKFRVTPVGRSRQLSLLPFLTLLINSMGSQINSICDSALATALTYGDKTDPNWKQDIIRRTGRASSSSWVHWLQSLAHVLTWLSKAASHTKSQKIYSLSSLSNPTPQTEWSEYLSSPDFTASLSPIPCVSRSNTIYIPEKKVLLCHCYLAPLRKRKKTLLIFKFSPKLLLICLQLYPSSLSSTAVLKSKCYKKTMLRHKPRRVK